jgi:hypothetical protein
MAGGLARKRNRRTCFDGGSAGKMCRLGQDSIIPHRLKYKKLTR